MIFVVNVDFDYPRFSSVPQSCPTLCNPMDCSTPGFPVHHQLSELAQTHVHGVGDAIQPSHSVISFSFCLHSFPASGYFPVSQFSTSRGQIIGISASASVLPMNFDLISFKIDWFDLLEVQGTLKTLLQHQSSQVKPLITSQRYHLSGFFTVVHHACLRVGKFYSRSSRVEFLHKLCRTSVHRILSSFLLIFIY